MTCEICELIKDKKAKRIFSDELIEIVMSPKPASLGHILIYPKEHKTILEQVPDNIVSHIFNAANKLSAVLFEALGEEGTNIIIQNGLDAGQTIPHFSINIIPRKENDGINFEWKPQSISDPVMDEVTSKLSSSISGIKEKVAEDKVEEIKEEEITNYMIKQLERIP